MLQNVACLLTIEIERLFIPYLSNNIKLLKNESQWKLYDNVVLQQL